MGEGKGLIGIAIKQGEKVKFQEEANKRGLTLSNLCKRAIRFYLAFDARDYGLIRDLAGDIENLRKADEAIPRELL